MSPVPVPAGASATPPATPADALSVAPDVLREDAVALAPDVTGHDAVADPGVLPQGALPVVVPEDARTQLERVNVKGAPLDAIFRGARTFNDKVGDGRSVDELTLGLLWLSEGLASLKVRLDPAHPSFGAEQATWIAALVALQAQPADMRRAWRISNLGLWSFGLDDIFILDTGLLTDLVFATSEARWQARMLLHGGWTKAVPFLGTLGATNPTIVTSVAPVEVSCSSTEAAGFLVAVAARFTKQLAALPDELARRGIVLSTDRVEQIPRVEPVLAYMCYLTRADKAAALWEALIFLTDFGIAVTLAAPAPSDPASPYDLFFVIDVLNHWLGPLRDATSLGLPATLRSLVEDDTAQSPGGRPGRTVLDDVAARADWNPIPRPADLDPAGTALLQELVDGWQVYARRMSQLQPKGTVLLAPGELFFQGADSSVALPLFPSQLGTTGFGARNYGQRFQTATQLPLGAQCRRVPA